MSFAVVAPKTRERPEVWPRVQLPAPQPIPKPPPALLRSHVRLDHAKSRGWLSALSLPGVWQVGKFRASFNYPDLRRLQSEEAQSVTCG
eukprot:3087766-Amphidinium_carterae.1